MKIAHRFGQPIVQHCGHFVQKISRREACESQTHNRNVFGDESTPAPATPAPETPAPAAPAPATPAPETPAPETPAPETPAPEISVDSSKPITVEGGQITGTLTEDSQIAMWKGIPYAAAPVGDLRWRVPQPVENWDGVKKCVEFGSPAMQAMPTPSAPYTAKFLISNAENMSEDCLTLNIWSPSGVTDELLPVIFYIHGGGNTEGGSNIEIYDGEKLARQGVVYVSINYRLGIFGSMAHPQLSAEDEHGVSGNQAMLDQIKALQWVHDHIAKFGGDPDNVTIAGQSAGGMTINIEAKMIVRL